MTAELLMLIRAFVVLQSRLLAAFREAYPDVADWPLLLDCPKSGELMVRGENWTFRKHGTGLHFSNAAGIVVDMHRALPDAGVFDAWRVLLYLESIQPPPALQAMIQATLEAKLADLASSRHILKASSEGTYTLNTPLRGARAS
jgi:hypothetical protein